MGPGNLRPKPAVEDEKTKLKDRAYTLNTSSWKDGVYIVRANYNGELLTEKLVVKKL
jgi:hypothetical protein